MKSKSKPTIKKSLIKPLQKIVDLIKKPNKESKQPKPSKEKVQDDVDIDNIIENPPDDVKNEVAKCGLTVEDQLEDAKKFLSQNDEQPSNDDLDNDIDDDDSLDSADLDSQEHEQPERNDTSSNGFNPDVSFFYTNDKALNQFEDDEIIEYIQEKFPMFMSQDVDDIIMRRTIIEILNDTFFMKKMLAYYDMNIFDFIKFLYRKESSIFKGQFIKRIQKTLKRKKYVIEAKQQAYRYSPKSRKRRTSKKQR